MLTYILAGTAIAGIAVVLFIAKWVESRHTLNAILNEPAPITPDELVRLFDEAEKRIGRVS